MSDRLVRPSQCRHTAAAVRFRQWAFVALQVVYQGFIRQLFNHQLLFPGARHQWFHLFHR